MNKPTIALYLHIPFCKKPYRCIYCDFFSTTLGEAWRRKYTDSICKELDARKNEASAPLSSIYFGGGTPSRLSIDELQQIMQAIRHFYAIMPEAEITIEVNPDDVNEAYAKSLAAMGFNRVSMGVQSFDDRLLSVIQRKHTGRQAVDAVRTLHEAGFENVSIDLIYGLPQQKPADFAKDLETAMMLPVTHLSAYSLMVEENTKLHQMLENGMLTLPTEDETLEMFELLCRKTGENGFEQYEISNFSRRGYESRHNSSYWQGVPYIGVGAGAHSYDGKDRRRFNKTDLKAYIEADGCPPNEVEVLSEQELYNEFVFTRLRTRRGLNIQDLNQRFQSRFKEDFASTAERHSREGNICFESDGSIRLTHKGLMISNDVMSDFMQI